MKMGSKLPPSALLATFGNQQNAFEVSDFGSDPNLSAQHLMSDFLNSG